MSIYKTVCCLLNLKLWKGMVIFMLKQIYVSTDIFKKFPQAKKDYNAFVYKMNRNKINVHQLDIKNDLDNSNIFMDILKGLLNDSLVITTRLNIVNMEEKNIFCVGFGEDYRGKIPYIIADLYVTYNYMRLIYARYTHTPFVVANTNRLLLREIQLEDVKDLCKLYDTLSDCPYLEPLYSYEKELEFTKNYIKNMYAFYQYGLWLVYEKSTQELIGRVGIENRQIDGILRQELGYVIGKNYQHKGYAYEAAKAVIKYAKEELFLEELFICVQKDNIPSVGLAEKLGFTPYGEAQEFILYHSFICSTGNEENSHIYMDI